MNNLKEGKGTYYFKDGRKYVGCWKNDKQEGEGIMHYPNGDQLHITWVNGKAHGKGKYIYANGTFKTREYDNGNMTKEYGKIFSMFS